MPYKKLECGRGETLYVLDVDGYLIPAFETVSISLSLLCFKFEPKCG